MKKSNPKKLVVKLVIIIIIALFIYAILDIYFVKKEYSITGSDKHPFIEQIKKDVDEEVTPIELPDLPESAYIDLPFISQSPFATWDALHEDVCEEASLLMIKYQKENKNNISKTEADQDIKLMVAYEKSNEYETSITLEELNQVSKSYLGFSGEVIDNISIDDIKVELANGKPVIVGAAGKTLDNPNFRNGGPNYHMLVIIGYDADGFITNDPGTRKGENYRYSYENLYESIHDWNPDNILEGKKNYLVF